MIVAELTGLRRFEIEDRPLPAPAPGEVQVQIGAIGVCGSDMHSYAEGGVGDSRCIYPMVLGHEPSGTIVDIGEGVSGWSVGDRAALEPAIFCYHCEFCMSGRYNLCAHLVFLSTPEHAGFFRDRINLPATNLLGIPASISLAEAALVEPIAVVLHSLQFAKPQLGETAVVFGAGPIGLLTVIALKMAGVARVWVVEPVGHRRVLAHAIGADELLETQVIDPVRQIILDTGGRGVDIAIDCAAKDNTLNQCLGALRSGGRLVYTGIPAELQVPLDVHPMRKKEIAIFNVRRSNNEATQARDLLAAQPAKFAPLITHTRPLTSVNEAFQLLEHYDDGVGKMVLLPG